MRKITKSENMILQRLMFDEPFNTVQEETGLQFGELRDDLMTLINDGFVEVTNTDKLRIPYFDADRPQLFSYRATRSGLNALKMNKT